MSTLLTELFPIRRERVPALRAYHVTASESAEMNVLGRSLPWQIQRQRPGDETWIWSGVHQCLFADARCGEEELQSVVEACWETGQDRFTALRGIGPTPETEPDAHAIADYVAWGIWHEVNREVLAHLKGEGLAVSPVQVRRRADRSAAVVEGTPTLRLSIRSEVTHEHTLGELWSQRPELDLEGLAVKDRTKDRNPLKGTIEGVAGPLNEHRTRLLKYGPPDDMRKLLQSADGTTPVVEVVPFGGGRSYDYLVDALDLIVHPRHYDRLGIPTRVQNKLTLSPEKRFGLVRQAAKPFRNRGWIEKPLSSRSRPSAFGTAESVGYAPTVKMGDDATVEDEQISVRTIRDHGSVVPVSTDRSPMQLAILKVGAPPRTEGFGEQIKEKLAALGIDSIGGKLIATEAEPSAVRKKAQTISSGDFDAALALLPDGTEQIYRTWKQETVPRNLPNQVINHSTLGNRYALDNIALGLFAKMGGVPYVLAEPLPYADRVVGLDIGRVQKERAAGTMSVAASVHLYGADGQFLGYRLEEASVEGDTIPPDVLRRMFPPEAYQEKDVLVHRDGPFRGTEADTFQGLGKEMDTTFHLVEVRKQGAPRVYASRGDGIHQPSKGSYVRLNDRAAHLVSSPPPHGRSTARPLQVRLKGRTLSIEEAVHSVLSFTLMHHGSVRRPRLPVSLHYSDDVAHRLQHGIRPEGNKGQLPYWL